MQLTRVMQAPCTQSDVQHTIAEALGRRFSIERHAVKRLEKMFGWCRSKAEKILVGDTRITAADLINMLREMDPAFADEVMGALTNGKVGAKDEAKAAAFADLFERAAREIRQQARDHEARFDDTC